MRFLYSPAYTLVELLIALALSLLLLLGVAELFQRVGGSLNEARSVISVSAQLNETAMLLRDDLRLIDKNLAEKPAKIAEYLSPLTDDEAPPPDNYGYLEIIEGPDTVSDHPYVDENGLPDPTVGDVDDIIAFTITNRVVPFRGVIRDGVSNEKIVGRDSAEVVWFVRGNTLYRRVRLIDDVRRKENDHKEVFFDEDEKKPFPTKGDLNSKTPTEAGYAIVEQDETSDDREQRYDAVKNSEGEWQWKTLLSHEDLALRARRFGHVLPSNEFPHPLYDGQNDGWRYLRMPTIAETDYWGIQHWKTDSKVPDPPTESNPDLWEQPYFFPDLQNRKSGSLEEAVDDSPNSPVGEDVVLTNVLSFDVKVWCPDTKDFVDLGAADTIWSHDNNNYRDELPGVWDSWTAQYANEDPPYTKPLTAVQITIRCFEPASRIIKQVTVVHRFQ